jgi:hypothetical protein
VDCLVVAGNDIEVSVSHPVLRHEDSHFLAHFGLRAQLTHLILSLVNFSLLLLQLFNLAWRLNPLSSVQFTHRVLQVVAVFERHGSVTTKSVLSIGNRLYLQLVKSDSAVALFDYHQSFWNLACHKQKLTKFVLFYFYVVGKWKQMHEIHSFKQVDCLQEM